MPKHNLETSNPRPLLQHPPRPLVQQSGNRFQTLIGCHVSRQQCNHFITACLFWQINRIRGTDAHILRASTSIRQYGSNTFVYKHSAFVPARTTLPTISCPGTQTSSVNSSLLSRRSLSRQSRTASRLLSEVND